MIGFGFDSHRIVKGRRLFLGGVLIEGHFGPIAHSDGDVVLHSLIDALLGAMGKGDIGTLFPDTDPKLKDIESSRLLEQVLEILKQENKRIINIDFTVVFELVRLGNFKQKIKENVARLCGIDSCKVNVKAKTNEKMGYIGRGEGIEAFCVCQIE